MSDERKYWNVLAVIGLPMVAVGSTFFLLMFSGFYINGLPRMYDYDSSRWWLRNLGTICVCTAIPWICSLPILKRRSIHLYFLLCLIAAASALYIFGGGDGFLDKASRRDF